MNIQEDIKLGFEALKLKREAIKKIIGKTDNGWSITLIIGISAALNALFLALFKIQDPITQETAEYNMVIGALIFAPIAFIIGTSIIHLGAKILGGKGTGMGMYKGIGSMSMIQVINWIPVISFFAGIWSFVANIVAISEIHQFSKWRAFFSMIIVAVILGAIVFIIFGAAIMGAIAALLGTGTITVQ